MANCSHKTRTTYASLSRNTLEKWFWQRTNNTCRIDSLTKIKKLFWERSTKQALLSVLLKQWHVLIAQNLMETTACILNTHCDSATLSWDLYYSIYAIIGNNIKIYLHKEEKCYRAVARNQKEVFIHFKRNFIHLKKTGSNKKLKMK